jgi:hypothetical protein
VNIKQYRLADLAVLSVLAFLASLVSELAFKQVTHSLVYVNFGLLIGIIAMVRWNGFGAIPFVLAGIPLYWFRHLPGDVLFQLLFYVFSNAAIGLSVLAFRFLKKATIGTTFLGSAFYLGIVYALLVLVKATVLWISGEAFFASIVVVFTTELLTFVITSLAFLFLARFGKGLIVDMKQYIIHAQEEAKRLENQTPTS